jgi:hypothetical protein
MNKHDRTRIRSAVAWDGARHELAKRAEDQPLPTIAGDELRLKADAKACRLRIKALVIAISDLQDKLDGERAVLRSLARWKDMSKWPGGKDEA